MPGGRVSASLRRHSLSRWSTAIILFATLAALGLPGTAAAQGGWQIQNLPALPAGNSYNIAALSAVSATDLWVAGNIMPGYDTFIGRSADGGATWTVVHRSALGIVYRLSALSTNDAYIGGIWGLFKSTADGGATWNQEQNNIPDPPGTYHGVGPDGHVYGMTLVGGQPWTAGYDGYTAGVIYHRVPGRPQPDPANPSPNTPWWLEWAETSRAQLGISAVDASTAWSVGVVGTIWKTVNGGVGWGPQVSGVATQLNDVVALNANTAWVVGDSGVILKTVNGGSTWTAQASGTTEQLRRIAAASVNTAWAVGANGIILYTNDGGTTWTRQLSGTTATLNGVTAVDETTAWVVGDSSTILATTDGGTGTWAAPTVASITPSTTGTGTSGATPVTITGTGFRGGQLDVVIGGTSAGNITWINTTTIQALAYNGHLGPQNVVVINEDGQSAMLSGGLTYLPSPTATGFSPYHGPSDGGFSVTVTGANLQDVTSVTFVGQTTSGREPLTVTSASATQVTATLPVNASRVAESGYLEVTTSYGESTGVQYFTLDPDGGATFAITSVSPARGSAGTVITVTGVGFADDAVLWLDGSLTVSSRSSTQLVGTVGATSEGWKSIQVWNPSGTEGTTVGPAFYYSTRPEPVITGISPASGPLAGGTAVTITGTGLTSSTVSFGGYYAAVNTEVPNGTRLVVTSPAHALGPVTVTVQAYDGVVSVDNGFTYSSVTPLAPGNIETAAGNGTGDFGGDGGAATAAQLRYPHGVAVDASGNLYIADTNNNRVRRVDAVTGAITTVAGNGDSGHTGDGGQATNASMAGPFAVAVDGAGHLYISDYYNRVVRRVTLSTGIITNYAGTGYGGHDGDGGQATDATLEWPWGLAVDVAGNLFIAEYGNNDVRRVDAVTGIITTVAGGGGLNPGDGELATDVALNDPLDVTVDGDGNLYIAEYATHAIRKVDAGTGRISTVAGGHGGGFSGDGGLATAAGLHYPYSVTVDGDGNLFITDSYSHRVRLVDASTGIITTVAGNGIGSFAGDGGPAVNASLNYPLDVVVASNGTVYVADLSNNRVRKFVRQGVPVITWANPANIPYGTALGATQLNATADVPGSFVYDPPAGTGLAAGTHTLSARFVPTDTVNYATAAATVSLVVTPATPVITWANPAGIVYGTPLGATQLSATADSPGSYVYTPAAGAVLTVATHTLSVTFTPTDTANYTTGTRTVSLAVTPATPVITWANPANIMVGTALGATQLNATANVPGEFTYTPPAGTVLAAGTHTLSTRFIPEDSLNYAVITMATATLVVTPTTTNGPPYTMTVTTPTGGKVLGAGLNCGAGGTRCAVTMPGAMRLGLEAVASAGYTFTAWTGDCTGTSPAYLMSLDGPRTCGATFTPTGGGATYQLTISPPTGGTVSGAGLNCGGGGATCAVTFGSSTTASLTATPASGYTFTAWGGACSGASTTTTVSVGGAVTCTATFTASGGGPVDGPPYTMTITPTTGGKVLGAGLNCGAGGTWCAVTMPAAMRLGIEAVASSGYTFTAWTGDCADTTGPGKIVTLNGPRTCSAIFTPVGGTPTYQLSLSPAPAGGSVTGAGLSCGGGGATCVVGFGTATTATLTATPGSGYTFTSWGGACSGASATTSVLVNAAVTCTATFTASGGGPVSGPPYTLTITPATGGRILGAGISCGNGSTRCSVVMPGAMRLGLEAEPAAGFTFGGWTGDCSGSTPGFLLSLNGPRTCSATFVAR